MSKRSTDEVVGIAIACIVGALTVYAAVATVVVEWATLVWTTVRLRPALLPAAEVSHVAIHALLFHEADPPRSWDGVAPPLWVGVVLTLLLVAVITFALASVWMRLEIWSGRGRAGLHESDPRRKVKARAFAKPRDWSRLQPPAGEARNRPFARVASRAVRPLAGEKRRELAGRAADGPVAPRRRPKRERGGEGRRRRTLLRPQRGRARTAAGAARGRARRPHDGGELIWLPPETPDLDAAVDMLIEDGMLEIRDPTRPSGYRAASFQRLPRDHEYVGRLEEDGLDSSTYRLLDVDVPDRGELVHYRSTLHMLLSRTRRRCAWLADGPTYIDKVVVDLSHFEDAASSEHASVNFFLPGTDVSSDLRRFERVVRGWVVRHHGFVIHW